MPCDAELMEIPSGDCTTEDTQLTDTVCNVLGNIILYSETIRCEFISECTEDKRVLVIHPQTR